MSQLNKKFRNRRGNTWLQSCLQGEREREDSLHIAHTDDAWRCIFAGWEAIPATDQKKSFQKRSICRANGFLPLQETLSHPLLMPILEDPKMELKTTLMSLRLGLLTAFQQCAEVNIFNRRRCASICFLWGVSIYFWTIVLNSKRPPDTAYLDI